MKKKKGKEIAPSVKTGVVPQDAMALPDLANLGSEAVVEAEFVSNWYAAAIEGDQLALDVSAHVPPEALTNKFLRQAYGYLTELHAAGKPIDDLDVQHRLMVLGRASDDSGFDAWWRLSNWMLHPTGNLKHYAREVVNLHRARCQLGIVRGAINLTEEAMNGGSRITVRQVADDLVDRLMNLHTRFAEQAGPVTQTEIIDHLLTKVDPTASPGVEWPYKKLQKLLGPIPPGKVIGLSAYTGNGKSMLAANLALMWALAGVPVIVFATEMELQFVERMGAILARIPKEYAEEADWRTATKEEMDRYRYAMKSMIGLPWEVVQQPDISPEEIIARTKALRRKYKGRQVIAIVDHAHRLRYPEGVAADDSGGAAEATRKFKNSATSDKDGGLSYFVLYQPKKPEDEAKQFRPVFWTQVRGHSSSATEMDIHMTIWRRTVKTTSALKTPWGTPVAIYKEAHSPIPQAAEWGDADSKLDDEHVYIAHDKHRIRGAKADTVMLNFHQPSGFIYENDWIAAMLSSTDDYE